MPKYIGPYDVIQPDGEGGKVYHMNDSVTIAAERLDYLRNAMGYRFENDPPESVSPVHGQVVTETVIMPPDEHGVTEIPVEEKSKKSS